MKMKDSGIEWIGEIPETWEVASNKFVMTKIKQIISKYTGEPILSLSMSGVHERNLDDGGKMPATFDGYQAVKRDNLLFCLFDIDVTPRCVGYIQTDGITSPAYSQYEVNDNNSVKYYYYYYLMIDNNKVLVHLTKSLRNTINADQFDNIKTIVPPKLEQQQIANFLDRKTTEIDELIDKINDEIEKLKQYQSSVITRTVTKGLDPSVPMKDSGIEWIGEIPETWEVPKLKHLLLEPMKYGATESGVSYSDKLPRYIRITDITLDGNLKDTGKLSLTEQQAKNYILDDKDILFARSGATVGKTFFYRSFMGKSAFAGYLISVKIDGKKLDPKWVYYFTQTTSYMTWINNVFSQSTIQNISAEKYSNLPISMTYDIKEQRRIVDYLDNKVSQIQNIIKSKQQQITELTEYKNSLIFEYVTGKKQVEEAN